MAYVYASVGEVDRPLRVVGKAREELISYRDDLVRLPARLGYFPRHDDVLTVAEHASKCVAWERSGGRLVPSHYHPSVQATRQRHPDSLLTLEVPREAPREGFPEILIVGFRI